MRETRSILAAYQKIRERKETCALATVVAVEGSSYRRPGARMLVSTNGEIFGSVSGGCLERDLIQRARRSMQERKPALIRYDTTEDGDELEDFASVGLGCNGVVEIWLEPIPPEAEHPGLATLRESIELRKARTLKTERLIERVQPPVPLVLIGAGHDSVPMIEIAQTLGWQITVVDCRSAYSMPQRFFRSVDRYVLCRPEEFCDRVPLTAETVAVVMTHNYHHDREIVRQLARSPAKYIGVLGAKKRTRMILDELGTEAPAPNRLHAPIGLDIGAETPQEIALSAMAEIQAVLTESAGIPLRERKGPIHARPVSGINL